MCGGQSPEDKVINGASKYFSLKVLFFKLLFSDVFRTFSGRFRTFSDVFGRFLDVFGRFRTFSDVFERFRTFFGRFSDVSARFRHGFGRARIGRARVDRAKKKKLREKNFRRKAPKIFFESTSVSGGEITVYRDHNLLGHALKDSHTLDPKGSVDIHHSSLRSMWSVS